MRAMKDSGIEWIGEIPESWDICPIKYNYDIALGKMLQPVPKDDNDELCSYMCAINLSWQGVDISTEKKMWFSQKEREIYRLKKGDLLVTEGGDVAVSCIWNDELEECYFQNAIHRVRPHKNNSNRFLYYWMQVLKYSGYIDLICNKATLAHFTKDKFAMSPMPMVDNTEQIRIVDYLDKKCAEIDALIAAKEKTNALLRERRQSIIYEAVTKGLDPTVPMKDSGIEWIGEIPANWHVCKLKNVASIITGNTPSKTNGESYYTDEGMMWVKPDNLIGATFITATNEYLSLEGVEMARVVPPNTPLVCCIGSIGKIGIANQSVAFNQQINAVDYNNKVDRRYGLYYLMSQEEQHKMRANGNVLLILNSEQQGLIPFLLPPREVQTEIASYLDEKCAELDTLIDANELTIQKLKEYRQSIIYEAVTGKVEV